MNRRWIVLLFVAALAAMVMSVVAGIQQQSQARQVADQRHRLEALARCQAQYNEANNTRTRLLTEVTANEREAERRRNDTLDATLTDPSLLKPVEKRTAAEQQRVRRLYAAYLVARQRLVVERAKADEARKANPVPPPPSAVCDGP